VRLRYGSYYHRVGAVDLQIERTPIDNALKTSVAVQETWTCTGRLYNLTGSASGMYATMQAFEAAYSVNGMDLALEYLDGRSSYHVMRSQDCVGGTRVVQPPNFPNGRKGENHTFRTYRLAVTGIRFIGRGQYMSFSERIQISGGGARWGCLEVNEGYGVRQQLRTNAKCVATQSGSAVGYLSMPSPPPPIWPFALVDELPDLGETGPETYGEGFNATQVNYGIDWNYKYEWISRLNGTPHFLRG
jgi:hypothetical protein